MLSAPQSGTAESEWLRSFLHVPTSTFAICQILLPCWTSKHDRHCGASLRIYEWYSPICIFPQLVSSHSSCKTKDAAKTICWVWGLQAAGEVGDLASHAAACTARDRAAAASASAASMAAAASSARAAAAAAPGTKRRMKRANCGPPNRRMGRGRRGSRSTKRRSCGGGGRRKMKGTGPVKVSLYVAAIVRKKC